MSWEVSFLPDRREVGCRVLLPSLICFSTIITILWERRLSLRKIQILVHDPTAGQGQLGSPGMWPPPHRPLHHTVGPGGQTEESCSGPRVASLPWHFPPAIQLPRGHGVLEDKDQLLGIPSSKMVLATEQGAIACLQNEQHPSRENPIITRFMSQR